MEYDELTCRLQQHKDWLEHKDGGKRLVISKEDLSNMILIGKDFRKCVAIGTDFRGANLENCNFDGAVLDNANFTFTNIKGTTFMGASTEGASLKGVDVGLRQVANMKTVTDYLNNIEEDVKMVKGNVSISDSDLEAIDEVLMDKRGNKVMK